MDQLAEYKRNIQRVCLQFGLRIPDMYGKTNTYNTQKITLKVSASHNILLHLFLITS